MKQRRKHVGKKQTKIIDAKATDFFVTNRKLGSFKYEKAKWNYLVRENIDRIRDAVISQHQRNWNSSTPDEVVENFVWARIESQRKIIENRYKKQHHLVGKGDLPKNKRPWTYDELFKNEFSTEAYMSQEDRIRRNLNAIYSEKQQFYNEKKFKVGQEFMHKEMRKMFHKQLGTVDLTNKDIQFDYYDMLPPNMQASYGSTGKGYMFTRVLKGGQRKGIFVEIIKEQTGYSEYIEKFVIHEI